MPRELDILISVEERHAENMLSGAKTVELRRRPIRLPRGSRVWVYSKLPRGHVDLLATVHEVHAGTPDYIWAEFGNRCCIDKYEFDLYFEDSTIAHAIVFDKIQRLKSSIALFQFRDRFSRFHPPQFFKRLDPTGPELSFLKASFA